MVWVRLQVCLASYLSDIPLPKVGTQEQITRATTNTQWHLPSFQPNLGLASLFNTKVIRSSFIFCNLQRSAEARIL